MTRGEAQQEAERDIGIVFWFVVATYLVSESWAAANARGLYQDGAYYLLRMAERDWFYLVDPARTTVQVIRQAPVVLLLRTFDLSLLQLAQVFSLAMLLAPVALCAACWFVAPPGRKVWALFPAISLLVAFSTMTLEAVGEAAIGVAYFWLLLFIFVFRTARPVSQLVFLIACIPAFGIHEGTAFLTPVMLLAAWLRFRRDAPVGEKLFLACTALLTGSIVFYDLTWIIDPRIPGEREFALFNLLTGRFLYVGGRFNLPGIVALVAAAALSVTFFFYGFSEKLKRLAPAISIAFAVFAGLVVVVAFSVDSAWSPQAQAQSRYSPIFASLVLGVILLMSINRSRPLSWARTPTVAIIATLAAAQMIADIVLTHHWRAYTTDLAERLRQTTGLAAAVTESGDKVHDTRWNLFTAGWTLPIMSIIFARDGDVRSILDYPPDTPFKPFDPANVEALPRIRGVSFEAYKQAMKDRQPQKASFAPVPSPFVSAFPETYRTLRESPPDPLRYRRSTLAPARQAG